MNLLETIESITRCCDLQRQGEIEDETKLHETVEQCDNVLSKLFDSKGNVTYYTVFVIQAYFGAGVLEQLEIAICCMTSQRSIICVCI